MSQRGESAVERTGRHQYEFTSVWTVPGEPDAVYDVLSRLGEYDRWWPQVRQSARDDATGRGHINLRSALPFTLSIDLRRDVEDVDHRHLRALVDGDMTGSVEWRVEPAEAGYSAAYFTQSVTLTHALVRRVDRWLRPVLEWNHAVAMNGGASGLRRRLELDSQAAA